MLLAADSSMPLLLLALAAASVVVQVCRVRREYARGLPLFDRATRHVQAAAVVATTVRLCGTNYYLSDHARCFGIYEPIGPDDGVDAEDAEGDAYVYQLVEYQYEEAAYLPCDRFLDHHRGWWRISTRSAMRNNRRATDHLACFWKVKSDAPTPDLIAAPWQRWNEGCRAWEEMPPECGAQLDPVAECRRVQKLEAAASMRSVTPLCVEGGKLAGRYVPIPGGTCNGRAVLRGLDVAGAKMYYKDGHWCLGRGKQRHAQARTAALCPPTHGWSAPLRVVELPVAALAAELARREKAALLAADDVVELRSPDTQAFLMNEACLGVYWRVVEGSHHDAPAVRNGRPVYRQGLGKVGGQWTTSSEGLPDRFLFYGHQGMWVVGNRRVLARDEDDNQAKVGHHGEERDRVGWLRVWSNALTPTAITERWCKLVRHDIVTGCAHWELAPRIRVTGEKK